MHDISSFTFFSEKNFVLKYATLPSGSKNVACRERYKSASGSVLQYPDMHQAKLDCLEDDECGGVEGYKGNFRLCYMFSNYKGIDWDEKAAKGVRLHEKSNEARKPGISSYFSNHNCEIKL